MAQIDDLLNQASEIRDADQDKENTALRVGQMLIAIIQHIAGFVSVEDLRTALADYAPLQGALVHWRNSRVVCLASMGTDLDNIDGGDWQYTNHAGDIVFDPSGRYLSIVGEQGHYSIFPGVFYVNLHSHHCYVWDATTRAMIEITDSSRPTIIDYRNNPPFDQVAIGESYYFESGSAKKIAIKTSSSRSYSFDPDPKKTYVFKDTRESMIWDATTRSWIPIGENESGVAPSLINQIISNIDLVNGRINTLIDDLAGLAFTGAKTAKTELDWDGTKVTVSLNTSGLSGCRVQETFPKQVLEGSSAIITIVPENDSHLMRSASYKIGANGEAHEVTISGNKAVINLSRINEDITVYLTASATAKGSFRATISDSRVSGTGATSSIAEGSAWSSKLSLNSTAEEGASITSITATMEGGGSISVNGDTVSTSNVTGNINIVANVAVVGRVSISFPALSSGVKITDNNNNNAVVNDGVSSLTLIENSSIRWKIGAIEGYRLSGVPNIQMESGQVGHSIVPTDNGDGTYNLSIARVTGNIVILVAAVEVVAHTVTKKLLNMTSSNTTGDTTDPDFGYKMQSVEDGDSYSTTLAAVSGATSNNDVVVKMGGVDITSTAYNSITGVVNIAEVTGDVTIIATACTGVVTAKANTSGAKITITKTDNSTVELTCDTDNVDGTYSGTLAISGTVKSVAFTDKTAILEADFGGLIATTNIGGLDGNTNPSTPNTTIKKILGLVCVLSTYINERFKGCSALERIDTIGWSSKGYYVYTFMEGCSSLKAIDLSWLPLNDANGNHRQMFGSCTALSRIILADDLSAVTNPRGWCHDRGGDINTSTLVFSGGKMTNVTSLEDFARSCNFKKLDISFIDSDAITNMNSIFWGSRIDTLIIGNLGAGNLSDVTWVKAYAVNKLVCKSSTPPAVNPDKNWLTSLNVSNIYVPDASVDAYKAAAGWNAVTDRIHSINEYTE